MLCGAPGPESAIFSAPDDMSSLLAGLSYLTTLSEVVQPDSCLHPSTVYSYVFKIAQSSRPSSIAPIYAHVKRCPSLPCCPRGLIFQLRPLRRKSNGRSALWVRHGYLSRFDLTGSDSPTPLPSLPQSGACYFCTGAEMLGDCIECRQREWAQRLMDHAPRAVNAAPRAVSPLLARAITDS